MGVVEGVGSETAAARQGDGGRDETACRWRRGGLS